MITFQKYLIIGEMTERHIIKPTSRKTRFKVLKQSITLTRKYYQYIEFAKNR